MSGEKKEKKILGFYFFLLMGVRDGQIHRGDEFVLGYQKKNGTIRVLCVYYMRVDRNISNGFRHG